jgi:hypothetical protein
MDTGMVLVLVLVLVFARQRRHRRRRRIQLQLLPTRCFSGDYCTDCCRLCLWDID